MSDTCIPLNTPCRMVYHLRFYQYKFHRGGWHGCYCNAWRPWRSLEQKFLMSTTSPVITGSKWMPTGHTLDPPTYLLFHHCNVKCLDFDKELATVAKKTTHLCTNMPGDWSSVQVSCKCKVTLTPSPQSSPPSEVQVEIYPLGKG